jgi:hypothetical protein
VYPVCNEQQNVGVFLGKAVSLVADGTYDSSDYLVGVEKRTDAFQMFFTTAM